MEENLTIILKEISENKIKDYHIKDTDKLIGVAKKLNLYKEGDSYLELAAKISDCALKCYGKQDEEPISFLKAYMPKNRFKKLENIAESIEKDSGMSVGFLPRNIDRESVDILHRTHMGTDHNPLTLIVQGLRCALADGWGGSLIATELQDILFGTPHKREINAILAY